MDADLAAALAECEALSCPTPAAAAAAAARRRALVKRLEALEQASRAWRARQPVCAAALQHAPAAPMALAPAVPAQACASSSFCRPSLPTRWRRRARCCPAWPLRCQVLPAWGNAGPAAGLGGSRAAQRCPSSVEALHAAVTRPALCSRRAVPPGCCVLPCQAGRRDAGAGRLGWGPSCQGALVQVRGSHSRDDLMHATGSCRSSCCRPPARPRCAVHAAPFNAVYTPHGLLASCAACC